VRDIVSRATEKMPLEVQRAAGAGPRAPQPPIPPATGRVEAAPDTPLGADGSGIGPLEFMLPHLEKMATVQRSAEGALAGFRLAAQAALFRLLRPYAFQQHQLQMHLIAALRQATVALRRQQQVHKSLDTRVRELSRELLAAKQEIQKLEHDSVRAKDPSR
jgi:hypothetical protein